MVNPDSNNNSIDDSLIVVGIGASAGGLAAFSELLERIPSNTGMAFVLVQHLAPAGKSLLGELLGRTTQIPVDTAEDGMVVVANHVYVIPPNQQMTIDQGMLKLAECDADQHRDRTIDLFFQSLAKDKQNKAIAVLLSGSNDDGALGLTEIREAGGITIAQTPATAEFPEMPSAAIATGQVDFVLPPPQIAEELMNISHHPYLREVVEQPKEEQGTAFQDGDLLIIFRILQKTTGVDFASYKPTTFQRRLRRRIALHKLTDLGAYIHYLQENPTEIQALYQDVLITVTRFFRDEEVYKTLQERVFPILLQQQSATSSIRIWVPGCSTGEEPYSIAICLLECLNSLLISPTIQIFGTDISDEAIEEARLGIYQENRMENVSSERRRRFFVEVDGGYQINKSVRELCIFARQDLSSDPPFSDLDIVSCRNVLIYFKPPLQRRVLSIFHYGLKPTGFMVLGNSESIGDTSELFEVFDSVAKIYTRQSVPTRLSFDFVTSHYNPQQTISTHRPGFAASLNRTNVQQWADQIVLNRYAPVGVIVNQRLEILQFRGDTSPYLRPPLGEPSFNLLKMIRPSLLVDVRATFEEAKQTNVAVRRQRLRLEESGIGNVSLEVIPFNVSMSQDRCFLILFERSIMELPLFEGDRSSSIDDAPPALNIETTQLQQELANARQELLDTQTFLRLTIEEQEATNQQLIAANEEILSSNEELKSTNEELQTAKEEIQSANEELKTTNEELQSRNIESRRANDDLINLINNVNIPILMLSNDLCIRRFTPMMRSLFNLIPSDIGRPISDIRFDIDVPNLEELILEVIETLNAVEQDVQDSQGCWYLLRIRPYRTVENQIDGAVVVLFNIDNLKRIQQTLQEREQIAQAANASKDEFLAVLSHELRTPLTSMIGWIKLLEDNNQPKTMWEQGIQSLKASALAQLALVEDLLDASRIIQDRLQLNQQSTDIKLLLEQAIAQIQPQVTQRTIQINAELEDCPNNLWLDPQRIDQVFSNLLSNALKFTPNKGCITVQLRNLPSHIQIQIQDNGNGISPAFLPHIFDRLRQSDTSNTRREGGLGLGLFLVRSIVEAHGGTVGAESPGEGQGATFTATLPKVIFEPRYPASSAVAATPTALLSASTSAGVPPISPLNPNTDSTSSAEPESEMALTGVRLLLIEDNDLIMESFSLFLQHLGATVAMARTAVEAMDIITSQPLDIIVSDIGLPDVNGYELMRQVRSLSPEQGGQIPAIALTGYISEQSHEAALDAGFQRHLEKPINLDELVEIVCTLVRG